MPYLLLKNKTRPNIPYFCQSLILHKYRHAFTYYMYTPCLYLCDYYMDTEDLIYKTLDILTFKTGPCMYKFHCK